jgi:polysaccharide export outer membrane protein
MSEEQLLPAAGGVFESLPEQSLEESYLLGPGDIVQLSIAGFPDYVGEFQVLSDGTLSLPLVGVVPVEGMSLQAISRDLSRRFDYYLKYPIATLSLVQARPIRFAVSGEVNRPGTYDILDAAEVAGLPADVTRPLPTVTQAVQQAGGITQKADIRNIQVRRTWPGQGRADQVTTINLWELLQNGDLDQDLILRDGDSIFIPTATALSPSEVDELSTASFSAESITVNVVGEVVEPGRIELPPNTTLNQAILAAGGFGPGASTKKVELLSLNPDGTASRHMIDVDLSAGVDEASNPPLKKGDTVIVRPGGIGGVARAFSVVNPILIPILGVLNLFNW